MNKKSKKSGIMIVVNHDNEVFVFNRKNKKKFLDEYGFNREPGRILGDCDVYELNNGEVFEIKDKDGKVLLQFNRGELLQARDFLKGEN